MALEVSIKKKLGNICLDAEFTVENEIFTILGASGCGKSMTLKCIAGIETPDSGRIVLDGRVLYDSEEKVNLPPQKRGIGYLFQDYALFPGMTVEKNIMVGMPRSGMREKAAEFIRRFHLEGLAKLYPGQLSGGQKQRVAMARMLAAEPGVILLDEPFSALDSYLKSQMMEEMKRELKERNLPVIFVTHDRDEAFALSHQICAMEQGSCAAAEEKREFFTSPGSKNAAILSGCKNIAEVERMDAHRLFAKEWNLIFSVEEIPKDIRFIGIRAHDFVLGDGEKDFSRKYAAQILVSGCRVEEALFEWNIYIKPKGAERELLWKRAKKASGESRMPEVPETLLVPGEYILLLH